MTRSTKEMTLETTERQRTYVARQKTRGGNHSIVFIEAFLHGIRDLGYKSPVWALAELIDNSIQAAATKIGIIFGFTPENKTQSKPDHIALIDDGNGMIPEMITYSVMWGGTDRENDRNGFGRYGYGLPSASVALAKRYSVYSKVEGGAWHRVRVDIEELALAAGDTDKTSALLAACPETLPAWLISQSTSLDLNGLQHGTIIVLEDLDRLKRMVGWVLTSALRGKLLEGLGTVYRHWIPSRQLFVDNRTVMPVDPLFLMEHGRFFDETRVRAEAVETRIIEVETPQGQKGEVRIRAALLPPNFQHQTPDNVADGTKLNDRFEVMKKNNGLLVCREGRHIDTVQPLWTKFQNYDYNVKIEIDFDPQLDEAFGITTSKQQIVIDEWMWDILKGNGQNNGNLVRLVLDMRRRLTEMRAELEATSAKQETASEEARPSVVAMEESEKFASRRVVPSPRKAEEGDKNLKEEAERLKVSSISGESAQEIVQQLIEATQQRKYHVSFESIAEGPFYIPKRLGEQKRVIINTAHPFYTRLYGAAGAEVKLALEVLLLVMADGELETEDPSDRRLFYRAERSNWSDRLRNALEKLTSDATLEDQRSAISETLFTDTSRQ